MPYIQPSLRLAIDTGRMPPTEAGELNYAITKLLLANLDNLGEHIGVIVEDYLDRLGRRYSTFNEVIGAVQCAKMEYLRRRGEDVGLVFAINQWMYRFYRDEIAPYEDSKIKENGDVYFNG